MKSRYVSTQTGYSLLRQLEFKIEKLDSLLIKKTLCWEWASLPAVQSQEDVAAEGPISEHLV